MPPIYQWCIVGAGLGGICMVVRLLEHGVDPEKIVWIDPDFQVGDLGKYWYNTPSNSSINEFMHNFNQAPAMEFTQLPLKYQSPFHNKSSTDSVPLSHLTNALQFITANLKKKLSVFHSMATKIYHKEQWHITMDQHHDIAATHLVLATGSIPNPSQYPFPSIIPLSIALNPDKLVTQVDLTDTVIVFGSSHSAILAMKHLSDIHVNKIINIYRCELIYQQHIDGRCKNAFNGLKQTAALWAQHHIDQYPLKNLERHQLNEADIPTLLSQSTKQIYATGFQRRATIKANINLDTYCHLTGSIDNQLYGIGIAYPLLKQDDFGSEEYAVGFSSFLESANNIIAHATHAKKTDTHV